MWLDFVLNKIGFVLKMTECVQNSTVFVLHVFGFVLNPNYPEGGGGRSTSLIKTYKASSCVFFSANIKFEGVSIVCPVSIFFHQTWVSILRPTMQLSDMKSRIIGKGTVWGSKSLKSQFFFLLLTWVSILRPIMQVLDMKSRIIGKGTVWWIRSQFFFNWT